MLSRLNFFPKIRVEPAQLCVFFKIRVEAAQSNFPSLGTIVRKSQFEFLTFGFSLDKCGQAKPQKRKKKDFLRKKSV